MSEEGLFPFLVTIRSFQITASLTLKSQILKNHIPIVDWRLSLLLIWLIWYFGQHMLAPTPLVATKSPTRAWRMNSAQEHGKGKVISSPTSLSDLAFGSATPILLSNNRVSSKRLPSKAPLKSDKSFAARKRRSYLAYVSLTKNRPILGVSYEMNSQYGRHEPGQSVYGSSPPTGYPPASRRLHQITLSSVSSTPHIASVNGTSGRDKQPSLVKIPLKSASMMRNAKKVAALRATRTCVAACQTTGQFNAPGTQLSQTCDTRAQSDSENFHAILSGEGEFGCVAAIERVSGPDADMMRMGARKEQLSAFSFSSDFFVSAEEEALGSNLDISLQDLVCMSRPVTHVHRPKARTRSVGTPSLESFSGYSEDGTSSVSSFSTLPSGIGSPEVSRMPYLALKGQLRTQVSFLDKTFFDLHKPVAFGPVDAFQMPYRH